MIERKEIIKLLILSRRLITVLDLYFSPAICKSQSISFSALRFSFLFKLSANTVRSLQISVRLLVLFSWFFRSKRISCVDTVSRPRSLYVFRVGSLLPYGIISSVCHFISLLRLFLHCFLNFLSTLTQMWVFFRFLTN